MKKPVLVALERAERALVKALLSPQLRPLERRAARLVLAKVLGRVGVPSALVGVLVNVLFSHVR